MPVDEGPDVLDPRNLGVRRSRRKRAHRGAINQDLLREKEQAHGKWLRYFLHRPKGDPGDRLLVSFSSSRPDTPIAYAHPGPLAQFNRATLFIRCEDGYWFGFDRRPVVSEAVDELLDVVIQDLRVEPAKVIACGGSEGGRAALLAAVRSGLGEVVVGSPTIRLGDLVIGPRGPKEGARRRMAETMAGGDQEARAFLNGYVLGQLRAAQRPTRIHLLTSERDQLYKRHMSTLFEICDANANLSLGVTLVDYDGHGELYKNLATFTVERVGAILAERQP